MAIIGNPPYWRFQGVNTRDIVGPFIDDLWEDLKEPVREAGWANQLNTFPEFSIAFWRWSIWKMFEADNAPGKGVIAFITNRTFLAGKPYAGLRKILRERFDRIEIIDLRGDLRRGERAGVFNDEGVFNIQVGTAITLAIADGSKADGTLASIHYVDNWAQGLFARRAKLEALEAAAATGSFADALLVDRGDLDNFKPIPFSNVGAVDLNEAFAFKSSGVQTKRDAFIYNVDRAALISKLSKFAVANESQARERFHDSRDRKWMTAQAKLKTQSGSVSIDETKITLVDYRPFDRRQFYNDTAFGDFLRPALQSALGQENMSLYAMPFATGEGPATWCHALLPDYHSYRGSYGGYAFPLHDRRPGHGPINLRSELLDGLSLAYRSPVEPQAAFDAILGLLSATSYTLRFAEDLEDVFPHVPFPADKAVFDRAAAVGAEIRLVETFARAPNAMFANVARIENTARGPLAAIGPSAWDEGTLVLCADGTGKVSGIPADVWAFSVSGYRVLQKWLAGREGISVDKAFLTEFRDITGRINELIHLFADADLVLTDALTHTLTRQELGLE